MQLIKKNLELCVIKEKIGVSLIGWFFPVIEGQGCLVFALYNDCWC